MFSNSIPQKVYTPEQVAEMLQLSKNTVYDLISRGEIVAKKLGKVYRIPASSISFVFTGLDEDLYRAEKEDLKNLTKIHQQLAKVRAKSWRGKGFLLIPTSSSLPWSQVVVQPILF